MDDWTAGYLTDVSYTYGIYRELTPAMLSFASLVAGVTAPDASRALTYCELGCGQGYNSNLLAAANPHSGFYATDFNPAHIAGARAFAAEAELDNVHFRDNSFAEFAAADDLPEFDIIAVHGIYSWVSVENRQHIVDILRKRLRPGGLVYISYNTLPGWSSLMPLRRLLADSIAAASGSPLVRLDQAMSEVQRLLDASAAYFSTTRVDETFRAMGNQNRNYLAHEYFNPSAAPSYFLDLAAEMKSAKLTHVGPAHVLDSIDAVNLTAVQQELLGAITDPGQRENARDYILNQVFRRDIFIKGAIPLGIEEAREGWMKARFILTSDKKNIPLSVRGALGDAVLQQDVYLPLLDALADGPRTTGQLLEMPQVAEIGLARLIQALTVLVGSGHLQPALDEAGDSKRAASTKAFNLAVLEKAKWSSNFEFLASPVSGGGVLVDRLSQLFLLAQHEGQRDVADFVWEILSASGTEVSRAGKPFETAEESLAELRRLFGEFSGNGHPLLMSAGIQLRSSINRLPLSSTG